MGGDGHMMKVTGLKELEKKMKKLSDVAQTQAKQEALYAGASVVQGQAVLNSPVGVYGANAGVYRSGPMKGSGRVGGNLRSSIDYEVSSDDADIFTPVQYAVKCVPSFIAI